MDIPKRIIEEVAAKMLDNRIVLEDISIVPNVFLIYVHQNDHADIRFLLNTLRQQIIIRLNKEVAKRDQKDIKEVGKFNRLFEVVLGLNIFGGDQKIVVPGEWDISFETTGREVLVGDKVFEIKPGEICVVASYSETGSGTNDLDSQLKTFVTIYKMDDKKPDNFVVQTEPAAPGIDDVSPTEAALTLADLNPKNKSGTLAILSYKYESSGKTGSFEMVKDRILIGRDPASDLALHDASNRVSRKHVEISYRDDKFFLKSFGVYGTTVQGQTVPISEKVVNNRTRELNNEVEVPDGARFALAGGEVLIDFVRNAR